MMSNYQEFVANCLKENPLLLHLLHTIQIGGQIYSNEKWENRIVSQLDWTLTSHWPLNPIDTFIFVPQDDQNFRIGDREQLLSLNKLFGGHIGLVTEKDPQLPLYDSCQAKIFWEHTLDRLESSLDGKFQEAWYDLPPQQAKFHHQSRALFLDRDGVIIDNVPYNTDPEMVRLKKGAIELINSAHDKGYRVIGITNQSGFSRGKMTQSQYQSVDFMMRELLAEGGAWIDQVYYSPYYQGAWSNQRLGLSQFRKPRHGMISLAQNDFALDLSKCILVGDSSTDVLAGAVSGVTTNLYLEGNSSENSHLFEQTCQKLEQLNFSILPKPIKSLSDAMKFLH
jgi:D-glycero-D-manno-heptose 1,7-bisphosphate phosphatase